jgi:nucleoid-associated protein YgaU
MTKKIAAGLDQNAEDNGTDELRTHVVQAGETLSSIVAEYYGGENLARWVELHAYNRATIGDNPNILVPGMELQVPNLEKLLNPEPAGPKTHVVGPGESLTTIAVHYYGQENAAHWITLYNHNRGAIGDNPDLLSAGVELLIPDLAEFLD